MEMRGGSREDIGENKSEISLVKVVSLKQRRWWEGKDAVIGNKPEHVRGVLCDVEVGCRRDGMDAHRLVVDGPDQPAACTVWH